MTVLIGSPFKSKPRISEATFVDVLAFRGSFAVDALWAPTPPNQRPVEARRIYQAIVAAGHDPAVWLAIAGKEHSFGVNSKSVLWRNHTRSWTNARSVRHPEVKGRAEIIRDSERGSQYVRYQSVYDSILDGLYRVDEPGYAYREAGAVSIIDHIRIWAPGSDGNRPEDYARTMAGWINDWIADEREKEPPMTAQIPGFRWEPADEHHYQRGRTTRIRGGAQHYTAGTNSLRWLTVSSNPPVSATFLVKHNPTMDDRGWQLVRIEDTAWTTAFANPYTVSIEYEHTGTGTIPDIAYQVLAQTWIDIAAYVRANNLGEIPLNRAGIRGHREWVGNAGLICPDGIEVDRIVSEIDKRLNVPPPEDAEEPVDPDKPHPTARYFPETGQHISQGFRAYWEQFGDDRVSIELFGYPLSEELPFITPTGAQGSQQFFERSVFEWHPDKGRVLLRRLGAEELERAA